MSSIESRVVQMVFDNASFEKGVASSLATLGKLNSALQLQGATKGFADVDAAANGMNLSGLANGVQSIASKFSALGVIGVTALANITNKVVNAGVELVKAFAIDPVKEGFQNYETQINAVQTILANTGLVGQAGLNKVNVALAALNKYANQTVYNFSDMAKNIGTFTAAGVGLQTSVNSIKGIANLAALSGSSADQASTAMYQLSQSISAGKVQLQDWNSVVNAGLGGKVFQNALVNTARASGVAIDSIIKKAGSFRNSLQQGWLTSDILTKTLTQFTGDLSVAQIKAMGYTEQQAQQIYALSQTAVNAATKIKTFSQLTDALKEEVGTAYAAIFKTIFGDINQATTLFTAIHNVAENALTKPIYDLNALLQGWDALGGRKELIATLSLIFKELGQAIGIVESAFREVFPPATAEELYNATLLLEDLVDYFKIGAKTAQDLKQTFAGVFAVFSLAIFIISQLVHTIVTLFGSMSDGNDTILDMTAKAGNLVVKFVNMVETGQGVTNFFKDLTNILEVPINLFHLGAAYVDEFFSSFNDTHASQSIDNIAKKLGPIGDLAKLADKAWLALFSHLGAIAAFFTPLAVKLESFFEGLGKKITGGIENLNFDDILNVIDTALFGGLLLLVKKFVDKFKGGGGGALGSLVDTIKESFETLDKTLETMQGTLKAATLLEIAAAVGILTISMVALAKIDTAGLIRSASAITVMFTQLVVSMGLFQKFVGTEGFIKMPFMMASLILFAAAIDVLAIAMKSLSTLNWNGVAKGLTGLGGVMAELVVTIKLMGNPEGMIASGIGLTAFAKGVNVLSTAVVTLSGLSWNQMAKGLTGVGVLLTSLGLFEKFAGTDASGLLSGAGIILLAEGIKILAGAMKDFVQFSWAEIGRGLTVMAGGLTAIGTALYFIPPSSVLSAAAVLIVAESLSKIGDAVKSMSTLSWGQIGKGLTELAGALVLVAAALFVLPPSTLLSAAAIFIAAESISILTSALVKMGGQGWDAIAKGLVELSTSLAIIAAALILMEVSLPGSAALLVAAAALAVLTPVMLAFGAMSWDSIAKSLVELAGVFVILGAAGLLLAPLTPIIIALGAAILLLGIGMLAAGGGVALFAVGLTALSVAGTGAAAALVAIVTAMLGLLPAVAKAIGNAVISFATTIGNAAPAVANAMVKVLVAMLNAINTVAPKLVTTLTNMLLLLLQTIAKKEPAMLQAGFTILIEFLNGIANNIGKVVTSAVNIVLNFLAGIDANLPRIIQGGITTVLAFVNGLANGIRNNTAAIRNAGLNLAEALIDGMTGGLLSGVGKVVGAAKSLGGDAINGLKKVLGIFSPSKETFAIGGFTTQGFVNGIGSLGTAVTAASTNVGKTAITSMSKTIAGMSDMINSNMDINPTITPVLDMSDVQKNASKVNDLFTAQTVSVGASASSATIASGGYSANQAAATQVASTAATPSSGLQFTQNNYSPKALSSAEIYRQTKNGVSKLKKVLVVYQDGGNDQSG